MDGGHLVNLGHDGGGRPAKSRNRRLLFLIGCRRGGARRNQRESPHAQPTAHMVRR